MGALLAPPRSPLTPRQRSARMEAKKALEDLYAPELTRAPCLNGSRIESGAIHGPDAAKGANGLQMNPGGKPLDCELRSHLLAH